MLDIYSISITYIDLITEDSDCKFKYIEKL